VRTAFIQLAYIGASVLFILGLRSLTRPDKARRGMQQAALGMLFAIAGTMVNHQILEYHWIAGGMIIGALLGWPLGMWVPMTAMPQRIALALTFSSLAATLVGIAEYYTGFGRVEGHRTRQGRGARFRGTAGLHHGGRHTGGRGQAPGGDTR
jgi:H+-translocating NAD(P) transhydrogenase subunit beta